MKQEIFSSSAEGKPFSSAIATESFVFVSGQGGLLDGIVVGPDIESQTVQTLENIRVILQEAGLDLDDVVKMGVYLKERSLYDAFNKVYKRYFRHPLPARTVVYCDLNFDILVEIDAIAVRK